MNGLSRLQTGSRFDGRATASLHGHSRRASPENVDCRIVIGIGAEPTFDAGKGCLALAVASVDSPAGRTALRREGGIDLYQRPAALFQFVRQLGGERAPALFEDRAIEAALPAIEDSQFLAAALEYLGRKP